MSDTHTATPAAGPAQASRLARLRMSSFGLVTMLIIQFILASYVVIILVLPSGSTT